MFMSSPFCIFSSVGAPLHVSFPHFLYEDGFYSSKLVGMHPDKKKHELVIVFEPVSSVLRDPASCRLHFCIVVEAKMFKAWHYFSSLDLKGVMLSFDRTIVTFLDHRGCDQSWESNPAEYVFGTKSKSSVSNFCKSSEYSRMWKTSTSDRITCEWWTSWMSLLFDDWFFFVAVYSSKFAG